MHSAIQAAVAAEHVRDMLNRADQNARAREARRGRLARRRAEWARAARTHEAIPAPAPCVDCTPAR